MPVAYLGLGSNLDAEKNLRLALREICARFSLQQISPVYHSKALGFEGADFLNAVAAIETELSPRELSEELELIHELAGRRRRLEKFVSRTLDIDLLLYDQLVMDEEGIRLPRSDVLQYSFVLKPLADIAPDYRHPVSGKLIADHWREFDAASHPLTEVDIAW
jgi:2-amino-4-hydroxy-6-hydroxymethyldihydropteridine diphosphokinase